MRKLLDRLAFLWAVLRNKDRLFVYNPETGRGKAVERYNIFTDKVRMRYSRFGFVTYTTWEPRTRA